MTYLHWRGRSMFFLFFFLYGAVPGSMSGIVRTMNSNYDGMLIYFLFEAHRVCVEWRLIYCQGEQWRDLAVYYSRLGIAPNQQSCRACEHARQWKADSEYDCSCSTGRYVTSLQARQTAQVTSVNLEP